MRALTLIRPWDALICAGIKRVENRNWWPSEKILKPGEVFAIHSGKKFSEDDAEFILSELAANESNPWINNAADAGHVIGLAVYRGFVRDEADVKAFDPSQTRWFSGPYGWLLSDGRRLESPVPCKGQLGLWEMPPGVEKAVKAQL